MLRKDRHSKRERKAVFPRRSCTEPVRVADPQPSGEYVTFCRQAARGAGWRRRLLRNSRLTKDSRKWLRIANCLHPWRWRASTRFGKWARAMWKRFARVCSRARPLAYTTVLTLLDRLSRRGRRFAAQGRTRVPVSTVDPAGPACGGCALCQFLEHHFDGSVETSARHFWTRSHQWKTESASGR